MALARLLGLTVLLISIFVGPSAYASSVFAEACQAPIASDPKVESSWTKFSYSSEDSQNLQAKHLLISVLNLAQEKLHRDLTFSANLQTCLDETSASAQCIELNEFADVHLPQLVRDARLQLIMAQSPIDPMATFGKSDTQPNLRMRSYGLAKYKAWEPASKREKQITTKVLNTYRDEIISHYLKQWNQENYMGRYGERQLVTASLRQVRERHFQQYRSFLVAAPFLHYFTSENPNRLEVKMAFQEFDLNANAELAYLDQLVVQLESGTTDAFSESITATLQYSAYLEYQLMQAPEYCPLATSLMNTFSKRSLGKAVALGLPLLAASIFAPEIVAYPLGIVASGYFALEAYQDYELAKIRALSILMLDPGSNSNADLVQAQNNLGTQVLLFPLSFAGTRIFGTSLRGFVAGHAVTHKAFNSAVYLPRKLVEVMQKYSSNR